MLRQYEVEEMLNATGTFLARPRKYLALLTKEAVAELTAVEIVIIVHNYRTDL
jgi:hypothetical protein